LRRGGPSTPEAKERQADRARKTMTRLWATLWANGRPLSPEARSRISEAQKRRSPESRFPSEETRVKISQGRKRFEASKKEALAMWQIR
jgi:phosphopantetheinyl transferase